MVGSSRTLLTAAGFGSRESVESTALRRVIAAHVEESVYACLASTDPILKLNRPIPLQPEDWGENYGTYGSGGYAIEEEENLLMVICISAPLFEATGRPIAAISSDFTTEPVLR